MGTGVLEIIIDRIVRVIMIRLVNKDVYLMIVALGHKHPSFTS